MFRRNNVRVIPDAGDVETVGADIIAKLSAETSRDRSVAAWDQRPVIQRSLPLEKTLVVFGQFASILNALQFASQFPIIC